LPGKYVESLIGKLDLRLNVLKLPLRKRAVAASADNKIAAPLFGERKPKEHGLKLWIVLFASALRRGDYAG
jgi:hypothetical protein